MSDLRPSRAAEYRLQAASIRAVAREISLNEPRQQLLDAASHMDMLAAEEDARIARESALDAKPGSDA